MTRPLSHLNPSQPPFAKGRSPFLAASRGHPPLKKGGWGDLKRAMIYEKINSLTKRAIT